MRCGPRDPGASAESWSATPPVSPSSTTLTGLVFSALSQVSDWRIPLFLAVPFVCWSLARLVRTYQLWLTPVERARIITTVAV